MFSYAIFPNLFLQCIIDCIIGLLNPFGLMCIVIFLSISLIFGYCVLSILCSFFYFILCFGCYFTYQSLASILTYHSLFTCLSLVIMCFIVSFISFVCNYSYFILSISICLSFSSIYSFRFSSRFSFPHVMVSSYSVLN